MKKGISKHPLYRKWARMRARCYYPKQDHYDRYGGRGIRVCDEWKSDCEAFIGWALENGWKPGLQIDRIDNDGHYSPDNCRFVDAKTNAANRSDTVLIGGVCLTEAAERAGVKEKTVRMRVARGMPTDHPLLLSKGRLPHGTIPKGLSGEWIGG